MSERPIEPRPGADPAPDSPEVEPVFCVLDADLRFNAFSPGCYSLARRAGIETPDVLRGRSLEEVLPERRAEVEALARGIRSGEPAEPWSSLDPRGDWTLWPVAGGVRATLRTAARERFEVCLEDPAFLRTGVEGDRVDGWNDAGRRFLTAQPELAEVVALERWLARRPQPRRLCRVSSLVIDGRTLWRPCLSLPHADGGFGVLSKVVRTLLHDTANPLSAVRMMAEVASRGSRTYSDSGKTLSDIIRHLDFATTILRRLRSMVQTEPRSRVLDAVGTYGKAVDMLKSELDRREVEVDLSALEPPEPELLGPADALLVLALGTLLLTLGRAGEGDVLEIRGRIVDDELWRVEGSLVAADSSRPWLADPELDAEGLARVAEAVFGGRLRRFVGAGGPAGRPAWRLELPL